MYILFPRLRLRVSAFALPGALLLIYCEGLLPFCILFLSCLLHEFGHLAALCICKCRYRRMDILPMGALIVCPEGMPYKKELAVALAGPAASALGCAAALAFFAAFGSVPALYAFAVGAVLCLFNLMPAKRLDGGKALLNYLLMHKEKDTAERICSAVSSVVFVLLFALAAAVYFALDGNAGVMLMLTLLLLGAAE
mgnify:FL=1